MTFDTVRDVEAALQSGAVLSARDLYSIWSQRLPVRLDPKKEVSAVEGSLRPLEWLQSDLETVTAFTEHALSRQEWLVSAAARADLLFIEALRERPDARFYVVLPWSTEEFFRTSVAPFEPVDGPLFWEPLFRRALEQATTVRELGQVYEPSDDVGWELTQEVAAGLALNTARVSRLDVLPVAL